MKVLLFGDIGAFTDGYFHVGDEAMFYQMYELYRTYKPSWELTILSTNPNHQYLNIPELRHLPWPLPKLQSYQYLFSLMVKLILLEKCNLNIFKKKQNDFISIIKNSDRIHFVGGGNINSLYCSWMCYSFFTLFASHLLGKEILLSNQTIGPFKGIDRILAQYFLNLPQKIQLREKKENITVQKKYKISKPIIEGDIDAAFFLKKSTNAHFSLSKNEIKIGLSLHKYNGNELLISQLFESINILSRRHSIQLVLIPHLLSYNPQLSDLDYMSKIVQSIKIEHITIFTPSYDSIMKTGEFPASVVKKLTSQVDVLIASRYHSVVFGLSEHVPTLALTYDEYYYQKNSCALAFFFNNPSESILDRDNQSQIEIKIENAILHPENYIKNTITYNTSNYI